MADVEVGVNLTGDSTDLEQAVDQAGESVEQLGQSVGSTDDAFDAMNRTSGAIGEGLDRAAGSASQLSGGLGDVGGALTAAFGEDSGIGQFGAKLEALAPIVMGVTGLMDLLALANSAVAASWVRQAAAQVGAKVAMVATTVATGVATAAQWLWNAAMTANPIGIIIVAVAALVAGIIWLATQTDFFAKAWDAIWKGAVAIVNWVVGNYKMAFELMGKVGGWLLDQVKKIPSGIASAFSGLFNIITAPWRAAFNFIARAWNSTIGRLSWSIPSWVPGIGGNSISAPKLPQFHTGGTVPGAPGQEMLAILQAGERVTPSTASDSPTTFVIKSGGSRFDDLLVEVLAGAVRDRGGDVQVVLGSGNG